MAEQKAQTQKAQEKAQKVDLARCRRRQIREQSRALHRELALQKRLVRPNVESLRAPKLQTQCRTAKEDGKDIHNPTVPISGAVIVVDICIIVVIAKPALSGSSDSTALSFSRRG